MTEPSFSITPEILLDEVRTLTAQVLELRLANRALLAHIQALEAPPDEEPES